MMSTKIPVTVVTGPLGSGKTTLLNGLLRNGNSEAGAGRPHSGIVVMECEPGATPFDHDRVVAVQGNTALVPSACPCCAVQGEMVDALRELFLHALHRKIPPVSQVIVETAGTADPASVMYTLKYDRFLGERFSYRGCVAVLDGREGSEAMHQPAVQQQAAMADLVIITGTEDAGAQQVDALRAMLHDINPGTACLAATDLPDIDALLRAGSFGARAGAGVAGSGLWSGRKMARLPAPRFPDMTVVMLAWRVPLRRSDFGRIVDRLQAAEGPAMLRVRGRVWFQGAESPALVNGTHQQLHVVDDPDAADALGPAAGDPATGIPAPSDPATGIVTAGAAVAGALPAGQPAAQAGQDERRSSLTLIYRGAEQAGFVDALLALAPGGVSLVSPGRNFVQSSIALQPT
jgi:G3E family GTPase